MPEYRRYVVFKLPNLRVLDFQRVSHKERLAVNKFFETPQGQAMLKEIESGVNVQ